MKSRTSPNSVCSWDYRATSTDGPSVGSLLDKAGEEAVADYKKGDMVKAKILDVDVEKERISSALSSWAKIKSVPDRRHEEGSSRDLHHQVDPRSGYRSYRCRRHSGLYPPRRTWPATARINASDRFAVGEKVDAKITTVDKAARAT